MPCIASVLTHDTKPDTANKLGRIGFCDMFVIDGSGTVRVEHLGDMADLPRTLEADLAAIRDAGTGW